MACFVFSYYLALFSSGRTEKEMMTDFVSRPQPEVRRRPSLTKDAQARQNHGGRTMTSETQ